MKRLILAAALACSACVGTLPGPNTVADRTTLDERLALGAELAYKAARLAVEVATDAGAIRGNRATLVAAADERAYAALGAVRAAYEAGNASSYATAITRAQEAVDALLSAIRS